MSAKLEQLLAYLDRKEVSEIIVGIGRPITLRMGEGYSPLTSLPVSEPQFATLLGGTPLDRIAKGTSTQPVECEIGRRRVRVELLKRSDGSALRIQNAPPSDRTQPLEMLPFPPKRAATEKPAPIEKPPEKADKLAEKSADTLAEKPADKLAEKPADKLAAEKPAPVEKPIATERPAAKRAPSEPVVKPPRPPSEPGVIARPLEWEDQVADDDGLLDERVDTAAISSYVRAARQRGASDLHIVSGRPVQIRVMSELRPLDESATPLPADIVDRMLLPLLGPRRRVHLRTHGYIDLAFDIKDAGRLRGNVSRQHGGLRAAFRLARATPPTLDELGLPRELARVVTHHQGLVVIAGPNGQGKTTTMAALVDLVNSTKPYHIITIEDPVELEYPRKQAVVSQREVGRHTRSFAAALKAALREDPDVIVIGELRDRETVEIALTAAETGHLVLATMSTPSAAKTIDRLIDMFPPADQSQARASIAGALRAVVAQRLLPAARSGGVVPAVEMVTGVLPLAVLIRDDKLYQLPNLMQRGRAFGMIRFEDSLLELFRKGKISEDILRQYSPASAAQAKAQVTQPMGRVGRKE